MLMGNMPNLGMGQYPQYNQTQPMKVDNKSKNNHIVPFIIVGTLLVVGIIALAILFS